MMSVFDFPQAGFDLGKLVSGEQAGVLLGAGVGDGPGDVVREEPPVIGDGLAELLDERGGFFSEAAFPHGAAIQTRSRPHGNDKNGCVPIGFFRLFKMPVIGELPIG